LKEYVNAYGPIADSVLAEPGPSEHASYRTVVRSAFTPKRPPVSR